MNRFATRYWLQDRPLSVQLWACLSLAEGLTLAAILLYVLLLLRPEEPGQWYRLAALFPLIHPPKGCPFSTRCPYCMNVCMEEMPPYFQEDGHRTMCWLLHEEAPVNPEYVQRKEAMRRADG